MWIFSLVDCLNQHNDDTDNDSFDEIVIAAVQRDTHPGPTAYAIQHINLTDVFCRQNKETGLFQTVGCGSMVVSVNDVSFCYVQIGA